MTRLSTAASFEMLGRARALEANGASIVHLEIGEPDFDTPRFIREAATRALEQGYTHYGPAAGLPELRRAIAERWSRERGIACDADNIVVTPGAKPILFFAMLALLEAGDEVLLPNPGFPNYESIARFLDARPVELVLRESNDFDLDLAELKSKISHRSRLLILNSPHNPTGAVMKPETLEAVAALVRERDLFVIADEIYARMVYEGRHVSIASLPGMAERTVVVDGFSKTYAMTGWRLGFGIMEKRLAKQVGVLMNNSNSCTATFVQKAGEAALLGPQTEVEAMLAEFRRRRDAFVAGLNSIPGLRCRVPHGAFYAFPNTSATGLTSLELADRLLDEAGVACLPGTGFGAHGEGHLRLSYANSIANLDEALRRIREFLSVRVKSGAPTGD